MQPAYLAEGELTCDSDFTPGPVPSRCPFKMPSLCSSVTSPLFHHPQPHLQSGGGGGGAARPDGFAYKSSSGGDFIPLFAQFCFNLWANTHRAPNARAAFCYRVCSAHLDFGETVKNQSTEMLPVLSHDLLSSGDWGELQLSGPITALILQIRSNPAELRP